VRRFDRDVLRLALNLMKRPEDAPGRLPGKAFLKSIAISTVSLRVQFYTGSTASSPTFCLDTCAAVPARPEDQAPELNAGLTRRALLISSSASASQRPTLDPAHPHRHGNQARISTAMERLSHAKKLCFEMKHIRA